MRLQSIVTVLIAATSFSSASDLLAGNEIDPQPQTSGIIHAFRESASGLSSHEDILKEGRVVPTQTHDVTFIMQKRNMDKLVDALKDISNPASANFGKHMTREAIADLTTIPESRTEVLAFLKSAGASIVSETLYGEYITARAPVSLWEEMFATEFYTYSVLPATRSLETYRRESDKSVKSYIRTEKYSVPMALNSHVASVLNTIQMPAMIPLRELSTRTSSHSVDMQRVGPGGPALSRLVTPALLMTEYNIDSILGDDRAIQAVLGATGQSMSASDLLQFQTENYLSQLPIASSINGNVSAVGYCRNHPSSCDKSNADVQYILSLSPSPTSYGNVVSDLSTWLLDIVNMDSAVRPLVISISYGYDESAVTESEFTAFDTQALILSAMGVTLVAGAGDNGANSAAAKAGTSFCQYSPLFPATSPYVLSVGTTMGMEKMTSATVCESGKGAFVTSGGGFSSHYAQPSYQSDAVSAYFSSISSSTTVPAEGYTATGRGYPDISAQGTEY